jgi:hypothetical protein
MWAIMQRSLCITYYRVETESIRRILLEGGAKQKLSELIDSDNEQTQLTLLVHGISFNKNPLPPIFRF